MNDCEDDNNAEDDDTPLVAAPFDEENLSSGSSPKSEDRNRSHELNTCACRSDMALLIGDPSLNVFPTLAMRRSDRLSMISRESLTVSLDIKKPC